MTSCILTIIKNEHLYLDEWITYHLNMGVSHIFIFEDIDSDSHKEIIEKYPEVSLIPLITWLSKAEVESVLKIKREKIQNPQGFYLYKGLQYVSENYSKQYDWCFCIDNDEFITLSDPISLSETLDLYKDFDAVILQWKCFGANGHIAKPSTSTIATYTKPITGDVPRGSERALTKTCYNLTKYKPSFFRYVHQPSDSCNYCRTDFQHSREHRTYEHFYLKHYITKSFEDYYWKRTQRGYLWGKDRKLDTFFRINSDLNFIKKDLLYSLDNEILVILPYSGRHAQGDELRIALNGWRKFCQFPYHFAVIGEFNENLKKDFDWVEFIHVDNITPVNGQYLPHLDIQHKMEVGYELFKDKYPGFIYMVDDNYAIRPFSIFDIFQTYYLQPDFVGREDLPTNYWKHDKWKTRQLLDSVGWPHINYTTHFPCYFNFEHFKRLWDKFDMRNNSYVPEDVYFNSLNVSNPLQVSKIRTGIWDKNNTDAKIASAIANPHIKFICNSTEGWSKELEEKLKNVIGDNE